MLPLLISFSGGRTSAFMAKWLLDKHRDCREIVVVFANTGKEREETLQFVKECDERWNLNTVWIEALAQHGKRKGSYFKIVNFETASRNGEPFEDMILKYGIPNAAFPHCSRELKQSPIRKYMLSLGYKKFETAIGIRFDEQHRINWLDAKKKNKIYPLTTEYPVNKQFIRSWWAKQDFDLQLKDYEGNCDLCWKKSKRKLLTMLVENPKAAEWWNEMEIKYSEYTPTTHKKEMPPYYFNRKNETMDDLIKEATHPFRMAKDDYNKNYIQTTQQSLFDSELDSGSHCMCN